MPSFASPKRQAKSMMARLQKAGVIHSVGTFRNYEQALKQVSQWIEDEHRAGRQGGDLQSLDPAQAARYLDYRACEVRQSPLDQERQAIQVMLRATGHLGDTENLTRTRSEIDTIRRSRAYTEQQVRMVTERQTPAYQLATRLAYACGLRAHELYTIGRLDEQPPDPRQARPDKFAGREAREDGQRYTVAGKGGLIREISIPRALADQLEACRRASPMTITDRTVKYASRYNLPGGNRWSASFTQASKASLGVSNGAHGLRHSYAQERVRELQLGGSTFNDAREIVSQELGHFRPDITDEYLR